MRDRDYEGVRKMNWDALWHALWTTSAGRSTWDRVTKETAMKILAKIESAKRMRRKS